MNSVHLCDCMEYMKALPDKAFDLAIVDPPYGIGKDYWEAQERRFREHAGQLEMFDAGEIQSGIMRRRSERSTGQD